VVFTATKAKGMCPFLSACPHAHPFLDLLVIRVELTLMQSSAPASPAPAPAPAPAEHNCIATRRRAIGGGVQVRGLECSRRSECKATPRFDQPPGSRRLVRHAAGSNNPNPDAWRRGAHWLRHSSIHSFIHPPIHATRPHANALHQKATRKSARATTQAGAPSSLPGHTRLL